MRADEHRAGVAHAGGDGGGVRGLDLQVLGRRRRHDGEAGLDVVDEDDGGLRAAQRLLDAAGVLGGRDPVAEDQDGVDRVGELGESVTRTAAAIGSCSAWLTRSAATCTASAVASARTAISVGPASESMPTVPWTYRLAEAT